MAASFPIITVLISPIVFIRMISLNYWIREYLVRFLKVAGVQTLEIFSDGERWQLRSP